MSYTDNINSNDDNIINDDVKKENNMLKFMRKHNINEDDPLFVFVKIQENLLDMHDSIIQQDIKALEEIFSDIENIRDKSRTNNRRTITEIDKMVSNIKTMKEEIIKALDEEGKKITEYEHKIDNITNSIKDKIEQEINKVDYSIIREKLDKAINQQVGKIPVDSLSSAIKKLTDNSEELNKLNKTIIPKLKTNTIILFTVIGFTIGLFSAGYLSNSYFSKKYNKYIENVTNNKKALKTLSKNNVKLEATSNSLKIISESYSAKKVNGYPVIYFK